MTHYTNSNAGRRRAFAKVYKQCTFEQGKGLIHHDTLRLLKRVSLLRWLLEQVRVYAIPTLQSSVARSTCRTSYHPYSTHLIQYWSIQPGIYAVFHGIA